MVRDIYKNKAYFTSRITSKHKSIKNRYSKFSKNEIKLERIKLIKRIMGNDYIAIIIAKYSRGDDMFSKEILSDYKKGVDLIYDNWEKHKNNFAYGSHRKITFLKQYTFSGYVNIAQILSLGILLNAPTEYIKKLTEIIDKDKVKDFLYEFLLSYRLKDRKSIRKESYTVYFHINERLGLLKEIIKEKNNAKAEKDLKLFLEKKWYKSFRGTALYNVHENAHNIYVGYWCFIAAAIVKIKNLDDSNFKDSQYYPKDIV